jgi:modulator of FtsH protease HflK
MNNIFKKGIFGIFGFIFVIWLLSGIYIVDDSENAVVLRFGEHVKTVTDSGMKYHLPSPIEKVWTANVSEPKRLEYGYRTITSKGSDNKGKYETVLEESTMLTGDENLLHVETSMQFVITDIEHFMFNVADPYQTLRMAGESAIRRVVANHTLDDVLTDNKLEVQQEIQEQLQTMANSYGLGVQIRNVQLQDVDPPEEVDTAFKDVAAAKEDKTSSINEAEMYKNEIIPKARGNAQEMLNKAEAYKQKRIAEARGDVAKFAGILEEYQVGKEVTRTRMYLETMEEILPGIEKYIVDENGNTVQFLPLGGTMPITDKKN